MHIRTLLLPVAALLLTASACSENGQKPATDTYTPPPLAARPAFSPDSAFGFVEKQVAFGPRIPGTAAHQKMGDWLIAKLKGYGLTVTEQKVKTPSAIGEVKVRNIIASWHPERKERVMLSAHYDTRPRADRDADPTKQRLPFDGANDGASGVGVLLELARGFALQDPGVGIDLVFWDMEDLGESGVENSYCIGSQYWAKNPHKAGYTARFGILLDMVGAEGAQFTQEGISKQFAQNVLDRVWQTAHRIGYGQYFVFAPDTEIIDDHLYVNREQRIPTIDIIHRDLVTGDFFAHHHRTTDNMQQIRKPVLQAVGETVAQVVYDEGAALAKPPAPAAGK